MGFFFQFSGPAPKISTPWRQAVQNLEPDHHHAPQCAENHEPPVAERRKTRTPARTRPLAHKKSNPATKKTLQMQIRAWLKFHSD